MVHGDADHVIRLRDDPKLADHPVDGNSERGGSNCEKGGNDSGEDSRTPSEVISLHSPLSLHDIVRRTPIILGESGLILRRQVTFVSVTQ